MQIKNDTRPTKCVEKTDIEVCPTAHDQGVDKKTKPGDGWTATHKGGKGAMCAIILKRAKGRVSTTTKSGQSKNALIQGRHLKAGPQAIDLNTGRGNAPERPCGEKCIGGLAVAENCQNGGGETGTG